MRASLCPQGDVAQSRDRGWVSPLILGSSALSPEQVHVRSNVRNASFAPARTARKCSVVFPCADCGVIPRCDVLAGVERPGEVVNLPRRSSKAARAGAGDVQPSAASDRRVTRSRGPAARRVSGKSLARLGNRSRTSDRTPSRFREGNFFPCRSCTEAMMAVAMTAPASTAQRAARPVEIDGAVLARCRRQDPLAFRAFVAHYERAVFALLSRFLGHVPHVEDLAQETFARAYCAFPGFDLDATALPSSWLLTIAARLALDAKKRKVVPLDSATEVDTAPVQASPEAAVARAEPRARDRAGGGGALGRSPHRLRARREFHELSLAEVAAAVRVPENTVKTRLFRARQQMRTKLAGFFDAERRGDGDE